MEFINASTNTFLYFSFGSNMLTKRIHINCPSARKVDYAKLENYKLSFGKYSKKWKGATATIIPKPGEHVYGVLWEINNEHLAPLDSQEGVDLHIYKVIEVDLETSNGKKVKARSYQLIDVSEGGNKPSFVYLDVIINGSIENELPQEYIEELKKIEHNDYKGEVDIKLPQ